MVEFSIHPANLIRLVYSRYKHVRANTIVVVNAHILNKQSGAGILRKSMGARNRGGIGLSYRPAGGSLSLESIPGPHKHLWALIEWKAGLVLWAKIHSALPIRQYNTYL
jgi:hypothetical protein